MITPQSLHQQFNLNSLEADIDTYIRTLYEMDPTRTVFDVYTKYLPSWDYDHWKVLAIAYNTFWNINTFIQGNEVKYLTFYRK